VEELRPGLWTWTAPHPDWHDQPVVRSYAAEHGDSRPGFYPGERVLWLEEHGALVFGDSFPAGPIPDDWLPEGKTRADYDAWLSGFRGLPVELVLPTHGDPGGPEVLQG
jgi:hypothetical protein